LNGDTHSRTGGSYDQIISVGYYRHHRPCSTAHQQRSELRSGPILLRPELRRAHGVLGTELLEGFDHREAQLQEHPADRASFHRRWEGPSRSTLLPSLRSTLRLNESADWETDRPSIEGPSPGRSITNGSPVCASPAYGHRGCSCCVWASP